MQLPKLFTDTEPATPELAKQSSSANKPDEDGVPYTYYRGVRTAVRRPEAQPAQPTTEADKSIISAKVAEHVSTTATTHGMITTEVVADATSSELVINAPVTPEAAAVSAMKETPGPFSAIYAGRREYSEQVSLSDAAPVCLYRGNQRRGTEGGAEANIGY